MQIIEDHVKGLGLPYCILRLPTFIDNNYANADSIKAQGKIYSPQNPTAKFTPIAVSDIGEVRSQRSAPGPFLTPRTRTHRPPPSFWPTRTST